MNRRRISIAAMALWLTSTAATAGEPLSIGALLGPRSDEIILRTVPAAIDMAQKACQATTKACNITPVKVADLPESVRADLQGVYPQQVLDEAQLYFGVPLNDPSMGIGFINTLGMIAAGGGVVMGMTFGNEVYLVGTLDSLPKSSDLRSTLAHELVHVAQYQALGYASYKEMYAKETAREVAYEENILEKEAFYFQRHFPGKIDPSFFCFHHGADVAQRLRIGSGDTERLVDLSEAPDVQTAEVDVRAIGEALNRNVTLALGGDGELSPSASVPQILDPNGGEPLHVFSLDGPARLLFHSATALDAPGFVAVAADDGVEVAWRTLDGFTSQRFAADARMEDVDRDGKPEVLEPRPSGARTVWHWDGSGFSR